MSRKPLRRGCFVRSVNFHNTFAEDAGKLSAQLSVLAERFTSIGLGGPREADSGRTLDRANARPSCSSSTRGTRNHVDVAAPLLSELGLTGIFCLIPGFIDAPVGEQASFAAAHEIVVNALEYSDQRLAMTWDEVRRLAAQGHAFACHTVTHADPEAEGTDLYLESVGGVSEVAGRTRSRDHLFRVAARRGVGRGAPG